MTPDPRAGRDAPTAPATPEPIAEPCGEPRVLGREHGARALCRRSKEQGHRGEGREEAGVLNVSFAELRSARSDRGGARGSRRRSPAGDPPRSRGRQHHAVRRSVCRPVLGDQRRWTRPAPVPAGLSSSRCRSTAAAAAAPRRIVSRSAQLVRAPGAAAASKMRPSATRMNGARAPVDVVLVGRRSPFAASASAEWSRVTVRGARVELLPKRDGGTIRDARTTSRNGGNLTMHEARPRVPATSWLGEVHAPRASSRNSRFRDVVSSASMVPS